MAGTSSRAIPVVGFSIEGGPAQVVPLVEAVTTIGRSVDNVLEIPDPNMSRRHCVIEQRETGEVILTDCNSSNGTKVNGERIVSRELKTLDEIECGSTRIRFAASQEEYQRSTGTMLTPSEAARPRLDPAHPPGLEVDPPRRRSRQPSDTFLDPEHVIDLPDRPHMRSVPKEAKASVHVLTHERDDLKKLLEITKELNQVHDLRRLLETIIDAAIELMAAERGFLILLNDGQMKIEIARNMGQTTINEDALKVSTQVCRQVIESGESVLTTNALADTTFGRYQSVVGLNLRSIICVPFRIKNETFGTVYLDAAQAGAFSQRDVELLAAFSDQAALAIDNARLLYSARQRERIEQELKIASQIQRKLLPRKLPELNGLEVYGWMHSAKEVGGDYYDFVPSPDGDSLYVCVGDVSGKGVPAGLVMASARSALRSLVERGVTSTLEIVLSLNRLLVADLDREMFLSFVLLRYDQGRGQLHYTGAGHENLLIYRQATKELEVRKTGGRVLGITTRAEDQFQEQSLDLAPGDSLVLYTDGVTEALNEQREQFELQRLVDAARRHARQEPKQALHAILSEVLRFKGRANQRDDITLVVIRRTPPDPPRLATGRSGALAHDEATRVNVHRPTRLLQPPE